MGRNPRYPDDGFSRGAWTASEDKILLDYIKLRGEGRWSRVSRETGLKRCGKSCRLRWMNYLRPDIKRGNISPDEEELIFRLHKLLGNRWSLIAGRLPGRTDNEIKNYWNTNLAKKASEVQLTQFRTTGLKPRGVGVGVGVPPQSGHPIIPVPIPQQATPTLHCKNTSNSDADQPHYNIVPTQTIPYDSGSSGGSPLNSVEDLMKNFNVEGNDNICQILESDFPGIDQVYLEGLLSPEPELEINDYLNMVEEQGFRNRFSSCLVSADEIVKNNNGEDCIISSDFGSVFESDQEKWPGIRVGDNDVQKNSSSN